MKRVLSGITSTNIPTLGNYLGAISRWAKVDDSQDNFFFIANSHAITTRQDPKLLRERTLDNFAWLLACGVDPDKNTIFVQSMIPAHAELAWILNNYTMVGELNRMTQYKDKAARYGVEGQTVGLYDYPVLMAADILLYDANSVPVGADQVQHLELTRDIATRFNNIYGEVFTIPQADTAEHGARIMKLDDPGAKMSKSDPGAGTIYLSDLEDVIRDKVKRAVTDSSDVVGTGEDRPALTNLVTIFALLTDQTPSEIVTSYADTKGYAQFKEDLANVIVDKLTTLQANFDKIRSNEGELLHTIASGNSKAETIAKEKIAVVKKKVGLL